MSLAFSNATTWTGGAHTFKFGGEYRRIESDFQFLGSNELSYNSINDFIDNRLNQVAVTARLAGLQAAAVLRHRLPAGLVAR